MIGTRAQWTAKELGNAGEELVAQHYRINSYEILEANWRFEDGEIDLICCKENVIIFCEVKTRSSILFGSPAEAVTLKKQHTIRLGALQWMRDFGNGEKQIRFDVACVLVSKSASRLPLEMAMQSAKIHIIYNAF